MLMYGAIKSNPSPIYIVLGLAIRKGKRSNIKQSIKYFVTTRPKGTRTNIVSPLIYYILNTEKEYLQNVKKKYNTIKTLVITSSTR